MLTAINGLRIAYINSCTKYLAGWKEGRKEGRMDGWMDGWMEAKAGLRIAYSNQKPLIPRKASSKIETRFLR